MTTDDSAAVRFVIERAEGYTDYSCVFMPLGVASQGETEREAILDTVEAVTLYVEEHANIALEQRGLEPLPEERPACRCLGVLREREAGYLHRADHAGNATREYELRAQAAAVNAIRRELGDDTEAQP